MKKVLIYGDSNTWGDNFILGERIPDNKQWPNILQNSLGSEFKIIQEGLPGRLAGNDEKEKVYKNGKDIFDINFEEKRKLIIQEFSKQVKDVKIISFDDISLFDDGIHLDFNGHKLLALKVKEKLL